MKKIIFYLPFTFITSLLLSSGLEAIAGGCNSHMNKKANVECITEDAECQKDKNNDYKLGKNVNS